MALDLSQFDEETTCTLIDSLLQEENEETKDDLSTECPANNGLKPTLTGDSLSEQVNSVSAERGFFSSSTFQLSTTLEAVNDEHDQLDFEAEEPDKMD